MDLSSFLPKQDRDKNLQALSKMVDAKALNEIKALLTLGTGDWERRYAPIGETASKAREVIVVCMSGLLRVMIMPLSR